MAESITGAFSQQSQPTNTMHKIHAPVLIQTELTFTFGVVVSKTITETANGESTTYKVDLFGHESSCDFAECDVSELNAPSAYGSYGIHAAVERHPGYKWAIAESERRMNPPEPVVADAPAVATEGGAK